MKAFRKSLNIPVGIPMGIKLLKTGAKIIGTETELVLKSRNVIPKILMENGFKFEFVTLETAFAELNTTK